MGFTMTSWHSPNADLPNWCWISWLGYRILWFSSIGTFSSSLNQLEVCSNGFLNSFEVSCPAWLTGWSMWWPAELCWSSSTLQSVHIHLDLDTSSSPAASVLCRCQCSSFWYLHGYFNGKLSRNALGMVPF